MRRYAPLLASVVVLAMFAGSSMSTRGQSAGDARPRFVVELAGDVDNPGGALTLDVTFYGAKPKSDKAEEALRHCLEAAKLLHPSNDIEAKAWFRTSVDASDRQSIALGAGAASLTYVAKDKAVGSGTAGSTGDGDDTTSVLKDSRVVDACQGVAEDQLTRLAGVGVEQRGKERKLILKAMRVWGKENDLPSSRQLRSCMSSISKAVVDLKSAGSGLSPEDLAGAITRGAEIYGGPARCSGCHGSGGRNGRRGPDLADAKWLHSDGSLENIQKVILSGVSPNELKDTSRTRGMPPTTSLSADGKELADLVAYVYSLSHP